MLRVLKSTFQGGEHRLHGTFNMPLVVKSCMTGAEGQAQGLFFPGLRFTVVGW